MSKPIVRASLYRHVHGVASKPEHEYTHIKAQATGDGTFITANEQLFAYAAALPGRIHVWPIASPGRLGADTPYIHVHKANVLDYEFNSIFHEELTHSGVSSLLATASDDCMVAVTVIPNIGLKTNITEAAMTLQGHERRINVVHWHPTASHLLATGSADQTLRIWDLLAQQEALSFSGFNDSVSSFDWHCHGGQLVSTCKDTKIRVYDPRHTEEVQTFQGFNGAGISRMIWKGDSTQVIGVGNVKGGTRQMGIWDIKNTSKPLMVTDLDNAGGSLFPYYDPDNSILYVSGKGDGNIRYWEVTDEEPYVHFINSYSDTKSHAGVVFLPKKACDYGECEIAVALRMMGDKITKVSFRVPRKQTGVTIFHRDLYPETCSGLKPASLTASEWLGGENRPINKLQWNVAAGAREMHSILAAQAAATGKTITAAYASGAVSPASVASPSSVTSASSPTTPSNTLAPPVSEMGRSVPELEKMLAAAKIRINELKAEIFELEQKAAQKKVLEAKAGAGAAAAAEPVASSTSSDPASTSTSTSPVSSPREMSSSVSDLSTSMEPLPGESEAQTAARIKRLKAKAAADLAREKAAAKTGADRAKKESEQKALEEKQAAEKAAKQARAEEAKEKAAAEKEKAAAEKQAAEKEKEAEAEKKEKEAAEQKLKQEKEKQKEEAEKQAKQEKEKKEKEEAEKRAKAAKEKEQAEKHEAEIKAKAAREHAEQETEVVAAAKAAASSSPTTARDDALHRASTDSSSAIRLRFHSHPDDSEPTSDDEEAERIKAEAVAKAEAVLRKEKEIAQIAQKKIAAAKAQAHKPDDDSKADSAPTATTSPSTSSVTSVAAAAPVSPSSASASASTGTSAAASPTSSAPSSTPASPKQKVKKSKKEKPERGDKKKGMGSMGMTRTRNRNRHKRIAVTPLFRHLDEYLPGFRPGPNFPFFPIFPHHISSIEVVCFPYQLACGVFSSFLPCVGQMPLSPARPNTNTNTNTDTNTNTNTA